MKNDHLRLSKFLSLVLRHKPETIGLRLDAGGWAEVDELLRLAKGHGHSIDRILLEAIVAQSDKQRFRLSEDGQRIRANQGHSFAVELGLEPRVPPDRLYHGTATRFLSGIDAKGILPGGRQYVHLSALYDTAVEVGRRHGKPVVLCIDAARMHGDGHIFFLSENKVWLTNTVPAEYLLGGCESPEGG